MNLPYSQGLFPEVYITAEKTNGELLHFGLTWPEGALETASDAMALGYENIQLTLFEEVSYDGGFRCRSFVWQYVG